MKRKSFFWLAGLSIFVGVGFIALFVLNNRPKVEPVAPLSLDSHISASVPAPEQKTDQALSRPPQTKVAVATSAPLRENVVPETGGPAQAVVRVKPDRVLATVNGVSITLKDLIPLPKEKAANEQMLSAEMYDFLFSRAVDREITFQAARAQGLELSESQKQRLAELRAQSERRDPAVFDTVQQNPENTEFEQRDLSGLALQSVLAEKAGVPSPYVTSEQVEAYFLQHKSDYAQIPEDPAQRSAESWAKVDSEIRAKLAPALQAEHDRQMSKMLAGLKAQANIVMATPSSETLSTANLR